MAAHQMVVHHAHRLHEGMHDGGAAEAEPFRLKGAGDGTRDLCLGGDAGPVRRPALDRPALDEVPQEAREAGAALLDGEKGAGARDGPDDLGAVPDDPGILHQPLDIGLREPCDGLRLEPGEGPAEALAPPQDGDPGQAGLEPVEDQFLVQGPAVTLGHAPFGVVISDVDRVEPGPPAARAAVGMMDQACGIV